MEKKNPREGCKGSPKADSTKQSQPIIVAEGAYNLVGAIIKKHQLTDRIDILSAVCADLEERFPPEKLEKSLSRMHMATTKDILYIIDLYLMNQHLKQLAS